MLNLGEINQEMAGLNSWSLEGNSITKNFTFTNFKESLDFVNRIGEIAEKLQHHPDVLITSNEVRLALTTHSENALTHKDFQLAKEIDLI
ncbi:MAG: 4a-hydroxytetrahydrobiopterin dehydratase [archaeon]